MFRICDRSLLRQAGNQWLRPASVPAIFFGSDKIFLYGFGLALLWYAAALYRRLRRGTAGVKPITEFVDQR